MWESFVIAFSTYSKIPMPKTEWNEKNMRCSLCFFPLVGLVTGAVSLCVYYALLEMGADKILIAAMLTVVPVFLNGGIHMDGFLDTIDAKHSYKPAEEKLKILKDPHTGAFAIIYGGIYFLMYFGFAGEITENTVWLLALGYGFSRAFSGLSVVTLKKAKKEGMLAMAKDAAAEGVKWVLLAQIIIFGIVFLILSPLLGFFCILGAFLCFIYYRRMAYQIFGGVTGDLAGYFLQVCELVILAVLAIGGICI